eukprot:15432572-Alexandrium_andersonii.AAC.1
MEVGHTHNELDGRFWCGTAALRKAKVLQTPGDFKAYLFEHMPPAPGRDFQTRIVDATWDWQAWLDPVRIGAAGL